MPERDELTTAPLTFGAIRVSTADRISYIGALPIVDVIRSGYIAPTVSAGLSADVLNLIPSRGSIQRKTSAPHVQGIVDYIVAQAELAEPWAFNSIVLYSTAPLRFSGTSEGVTSAGQVQLDHVLSVGEGLHRALGWAIAAGTAKAAGVRRPPLTAPALRRIESALVPAIIIEERDLHRQHVDFNRLNQQKPLTATVLALTDSSPLSDLTRQLISDVALFDGRIELNNAAVGTSSDKLLSFSQLRFVIASYLLGYRTRTTQSIHTGIDDALATHGADEVRADLRETFTLIATQLGGLERIHHGRVPGADSGEFVRTLRRETLLASNATWRALAIALHNAKENGLDPATALANLKHTPGLSWSRDSQFFHGTILELDPETDQPTAKLLASRETIDAAAAKLLKAMLQFEA